MDKPIIGEIDCCKCEGRIEYCYTGNSLSSKNIHAVGLNSAGYYASVKCPYCGEIQQESVLIKDINIG